VLPNTISVQLDEGGESTGVEVKNGVITRYQVRGHAFPAVEIEEVQIVSLTDALSLQKVPGKVVVIDGGIIRLEIGNTWSPTVWTLKLLLRSSSIISEVLEPMRKSRTSTLSFNSKSNSKNCSLGKVSSSS
jgi:pyruvate/2-oxoglutarate dehydrogenase complex dihydrolipoamide dehydrogenase (E3) component